MKLITLVLVALFIRMLFVFAGYSGDLNNHISWGQDILKHGLANVYNREFILTYHTMTPTYPPVALYLFTVSEYLYQNTVALATFLNQAFTLFPSKLVWLLQDPEVHPAFFKIWSVLADVGLVILIYKITNNFKTTLVLVCLNLALVYNSSFWGQIESIPLFFLTACLYFIKRPYVSTLFFTLALLTKQSSIIFIPIYCVVFAQNHSSKKIMQSLVVFLVSSYLISAPLSFSASTYINKIQTGSGSDYVTDHAFNFWSLVTGLGKIHDTNYQLIGYAIFALFLGIILIRYTKKNMYLAWGLTAFSAFLFLTRMHERYLAAAIPFLIVASVKNKWLLALTGFVSLFNLVNMYHNWWEPVVPAIKTVLSNPSAITTLTVMLIMVYLIYLKSYVSRNAD